MFFHDCAGASGADVRSRTAHQVEGKVTVEMAASVGTVVAAAMESAGYQAQSFVLDQLGSMIMGIATLVFIASILSALTTIALQGEYRTAMWFLIGPIIFYNTIFIRTHASGANWQFGAFEAKHDEVKDILGTTIDANVSKVFDGFNQLVSSIIQNTIRIITNNSVRNQMLFMTRQQIMDHLMSFNVDDPGLDALIHQGIQGQCATELDAAREMAAANREKSYLAMPQTIHGVNTYPQSTYYNQIIPPVARPFVRDLLSTIGSDDAAKKFADRWCSNSGALNVSGDMEEFLAKAHSCQEIWCWMGAGIGQKARAVQADAEKRYVMPQAKDETYPSSSGYSSVYDEIWAEISAKFSPTDVEEAQTPDPSLVPVIVGGILARKTLLNDPRSGTFTDIASKAGVYTKPYTFDYELSPAEMQDVVRRSNQHQQAEALKYEVLNFALVMPYLQGVLLFAFAVMFPFFAVLLVIPGKSSGFFTWMALWVWVKSWDVGWALVMVIDDVLWNLMPHHSYVDLRHDPNGGPVTMMEAAFNHDPAYTLSSYYTMVGVMLTAVPMVTAQAILGAKSAIAGTLVNGVKSLGQKMGGSAADFASTEQTSQANKLVDDFRLRWAKQHALQSQVGALPEHGKVMSKANAAISTGTAQRSTGTKMLYAGGAVVGAGVAAVTAPLWVPVVTGGSLVAAVGTGAAWLIGIGGAAATGGGTFVAYKGYGKHVSGVSLQRAGNSTKANATGLNADTWFFLANYTPEARSMMNLKSALAIRNEAYSVPSAPTHVVQGYLDLDANLDNQISAAQGFQVGADIKGAVRGVENTINAIAKRPM